MHIRHDRFRRTAALALLATALGGCGGAPLARPRAMPVVAAPEI